MFWEICNRKVNKSRLGLAPDAASSGFGSPPPPASQPPGPGWETLSKAGIYLVFHSESLNIKRGTWQRTVGLSRTQAIVGHNRT